VSRSDPSSASTRPAAAAATGTGAAAASSLAAAAASSGPAAVPPPTAAPVVVKVGGGDGVDFAAVCADVAALTASGTPLVLVHGGHAETDRLARALGRPPVFVTSPSGHVSRYTDRAALEVFTMAYCGKVNKGLVERLQALGVNAVGLSGLDGRLLVGRRKESVRSVEADGRVRVLHGDHTGTVEEVNAALLRLLLSAGHVPVLSPPALSYEGVAVNVDGDRAAAAVAAALGAAALLLLSNVPGLLADPGDESTLVPRLTDEAEAMELARGRMKRKVMAAWRARRCGVPLVVIGDARAEGPVRRALAGHGTVVA
jgi:acetylglutamate/LysW-gamma-L-alpha-aminoadipate kinase